MRNQRGMTLAEALAAMAIVGIIIGFSTTMVTTVLRGTQDNLNKQFATQKAISILEELRALVQTESAATEVVLDDFDDGTTNQVLLTTQTGITDPAHPTSGNRMAGGNWLFQRRVTVQRVRGANDVRLVNVKVYVNDVGGVRVLSEVAGVLSTIPQNMPPTQVYDVYLIAIENVPGWWLYMQNIVPFVEGAIADLEARHPGLEFRRHWIRKLSYGRDPRYTPYVNDAAESTAPIPGVYFYPGKLPAGSAVENYYPPAFFNARISVDGVPVNAASAANPLPYALADQYNHGMRYPEERALFDQRVAAKLESADAPTLRLLLDDMYMRPNLYRNAIVINLHGELFPFPPLRNYSDPAKSPATHPNVRAVTHPQQLRYGNGDPLSLRVYSYHVNPANPGAIPDFLGQNGPSTPVTVTLRGISWTPTPGEVAAFTGGVDFDANGSPDPYSFVSPATAAQPTGGATAMWYTATQAGPDTILRLYNSPLKTPCAQNTNPCDAGGLDANARLYALEYIPAPLENLPDPVSPGPFTVNLQTSGTAPKNTARWVITIPANKLPADSTITVETRIGNDVATEYPNVSRTYVWRGSNQWLFGDAATNANLPMTERFQLLGDPRHCPYVDLKLPHAASGRVRADALGMGYNRYFDDFHAGAVNAAASWPGWAYDGPPNSGNWFGVRNNVVDGDPNNDGWNTDNGYLEIDVPRIYQILRSALMRTNAVYTTLTGFSYYYVGIGGEIGYDAANGFPNSIPVSARPFTGNNGTLNEQSITDANNGGVKYIRENTLAGDYWWSMNWLGELWPDSAWATWNATGNLPTGVGANTFSRVLRGTINTRLPAGTVFQNSVRRPQEEGSTTFFWSGSTNSTFHHRYQDGTSGSLGPQGQEIANTYRLPMPPSIDNNRPFDVDVNDTGMNPDHFLQNAYGAPTELTPLSEFYTHATGIPGSALLAMRDGNQAAFVVVNGISPAGQSGVAFMARWSFLSLIQSFLASGRYTVSGNPAPSRVRELPRVNILTPNDEIDVVDPGSISVTWDRTWRRWDGLPYTPAYPNNFTEDTIVRYALLYSRDNGRTWLFMKDHTAATPGVRPAAGYLQTATSFLLPTPAGQFPKGNYVLRVEAYRDEVPLHYSFHQYRVFIKRS
jgi:prepilin-type N-terminal cleavage/methylation domain-containing protein